MNTELIRTIISSNIPRHDQDLLIFMVVDFMKFDRHTISLDKTKDEHDDDDDYDDDDEHDEHDDDDDQEQQCTCSNCKLTADSEKLWGKWTHICDKCKPHDKNKKN